MNQSPFLWGRKSVPVRNEITPPPAPPDDEATQGLREAASVWLPPSDAHVRLYYDGHVASIEGEMAAVDEAEAAFAERKEALKATVAHHTPSTTPAALVREADQPSGTKPLAQRPHDAPGLVAHLQEQAAGWFVPLAGFCLTMLVFFGVAAIEIQLFATGISYIFPEEAGKARAATWLINALFLCTVIGSSLADQAKSLMPKWTRWVIFGTAVGLAVSNGVALFLSMAQSAMPTSGAVSAGGLGSAIGEHAHKAFLDNPQGLVGIVIGLGVAVIPLANLFVCKLSLSLGLRFFSTLIEKRRSAMLARHIGVELQSVAHVTAQLENEWRRLKQLRMSAVTDVASAISGIFAHPIAKAEEWLSALELGADANAAGRALPQEIRTLNPDKLRSKIDAQKQATTPAKIEDVIRTSLQPQPNAKEEGNDQGDFGFERTRANGAAHNGMSGAAH